MCLQTTWDAPKTARKDIEVFKYFREIEDNKLMSPFYHMVYELNKLYCTEMVVTEGSQSFDDKATKDRRFYPKEFLTEISEGFHSALTAERLEESLIYRCKIPKGALYFIGLTGLVVSNKIIILEKYEIL